MFDLPGLLSLLFPLVGLCLALVIWIARTLFSVAPKDSIRLIIRTHCNGHLEIFSRSLSFSGLLGFRAVGIGSVICSIVCKIQMRLLR